MTAPVGDDLTWLADLERAHAAATPGPWGFDGYCRVVSVPRCREYTEAEALISEDAADEAYDHLPETNVALVPVAAGDTATRQGKADAALIVAAVNALPGLTAALRAVLVAADKLDGDADARGRGDVAWGISYATAEIRATLTAALSPESVPT